MGVRVRSHGYCKVMRERINRETEILKEQREVKVSALEGKGRIGNGSKDHCIRNGTSLWGNL